MDEPANVTLAICTDRIGPNVAAIVGVLGPHVDQVLVVDYREHPEAMHDARRVELEAWGSQRYPLLVRRLPHGQLSDAWNTAAAQASMLAGDSPWTLVLWAPDAMPDREVLGLLVDGVVDDYDLTFGPGAFAVGFPAGTSAALCEGEHDSEADCLLDLTARIPQDRTALVA